MKRTIRFFGVNGRVLLLRFLARLHCGLIAACLCAAVFAALSLTDLIESVSVSAVYLRGILFGIPIALSYYAAEKLPKMWQYLLAWVAISAISWLLLGHIGGAVMGAIVCLFRFRNRISEEKTPSAFDSPNYVCLLFFAVCFSLSAVYELSQLQRLSVISALLYLLVLLTYRAVERIEDYLELNKDMKALPVRRILRIAGAGAAALLVPAAIFLIPAALSLRGEVVFDLPDVPGKPYEGSDVVEHISGGETVSMDELLGDAVGEPLFQIPEFVMYIIYAAIFMAVAALLIYGVYQLFKNFRFSYSDNRDIIEALPTDRDIAAPSSPKHKQKLSVLDRSPNAAIRRKYRKTVIKALCEPPKHWQTPAEIEKFGGIDDQKLHSLYEKARYSAVPCTQAELRSLKEQEKV